MMMMSTIGVTLPVGAPPKNYPSLLRNVQLDKLGDFRGYAGKILTVFLVPQLSFSKLSHIQMTIWPSLKMVPHHAAGLAGPFITLHDVATVLNDDDL